MKINKWMMINFLKLFLAYTAMFWIGWAGGQILRGILVSVGHLIVM